ncbi:leucyl aminopeptidase [Streptomyces hoynatensis]|uniref:Probable cytosol aminopeptidase n=1 Tax=Streptomyces hoynatensis TaxID=1141874 RepID=A0A3A9Z4H2_9ACTN|nr:leucyl aminopeptidase [Streptomyces hoynatensis]RKN42237.1 leucyl aminopeptidase [Streptomyces hoynatensis]
MTVLTLSNLPATTVPADAVVIGLAKGESGPLLAPGSQVATAVDDALGGGLAATLATLGAKGEAEEITRLPAGEGVAAPLIVAVGLGPAPGQGEAAEGAGYRPETLRRAAGAAARALAGTGHAALALPVGDAAAVAAVAEGALLGAYAFTAFKGRGHDGAASAPLARITLLDPAAGEETHAAAVERALVVAEEVARARDLVNTPANALRPGDFAAVVESAAPEYGVTVEVLGEEELTEGGYGGILGVGQGSSAPPRLVRVAYTHPAAGATLALVGKGITYDSGGLSLKPVGHNETMKCDMSGAAAVFSTVVAAARLGLAVNLTGWLALAENMPSGSSVRPGDVLTMYSGKTVEVLNTDAEGRLVMADALARACEEGPDALVDVATLTGAMVVALGHRTFGVLGNDEAFRELVDQAAGEAGEQSWQLPMPPELLDSLKSPVADLANVGERMGGGLLAGVFLQEFVAEGTRWAHLDIAGPAFNEGAAFGYTPKGGTGAAVRTLIRLAERAAAGELAAA